MCVTILFFFSSNALPYYTIIFYTYAYIYIYICAPLGFKNFPSRRLFRITVVIIIYAYKRIPFSYTIWCTRSIVFPYYYNIIMLRTLNRVQTAAIRLFIVGFFFFFFCGGKYIPRRTSRWSDVADLSLFKEVTLAYRRTLKKDCILLFIDTRSRPKGWERVNRYTWMRELREVRNSYKPTCYSRTGHWSVRVIISSIPIYTLHVYGVYLLRCAHYQGYYFISILFLPFFFFISLLVGDYNSGYQYFYFIIYLLVSTRM